MATIQIKRFSEAGVDFQDKVNTGASLEYGEFAVNTTDKRLWIGNENNIAVEISNQVIYQPHDPDDAVTYPEPTILFNGQLWYNTFAGPAGQKLYISVDENTPGKRWEPVDGNTVGAAKYVYDLLDVWLSNPQTDDILVYDGDSQGWRNEPKASAGGQVDSVVAGTNVTVDNTDPVNPIVNAEFDAGGQVDSVVAGDNVTVDNTDPANPIISATGGGGGGSSDVEVLGDLTDVQIGVGYAGFTENVNNSSLIQEDYQYSYTSDTISFSNNVKVYMERYQVGDQLRLEWEGTGSFITKTIQNGSAFNDANTEFIRFTLSGGWPTDPAILAAPLVITSTPERFPGVAAGEVLTYNGTNWVAEQPTGGGALDDLSDVALTGFSESTRVRSGNLPSAPGEYRCGANFIQTHISHREGWEKYQVGDELTFVYEDVGNGVTIKGPFTVTTAYAIDGSGNPWGVLYASDAPNGDDMNDGALQAMTVFSNPERTGPETGEILTYDGTNWVAEPGGSAGAEKLSELDDVDLRDEPGYKGNLTFGPGNTTTSEPGEYWYATNGDYFIYSDGPQRIAMEQYQVGDVLTFTWASGATLTRTITAASAKNGNAPNYYIRVQASGGWPLHGDVNDQPITITSDPERFPSAAYGEVLTYNGTNWVSEAPSTFSLTDIQEALAESTDFESFKARMACL